AALFLRVVQELEVYALDAARLFIDGGTSRHDHVIDALKGVASDLGLLTHEIEIFLERSDPVLLTELLEVLSLCNQRDDFATVAHLRILPGYRWRWAKPAIFVGLVLHLLSSLRPRQFHFGRPAIDRGFC